MSHMKSLNTGTLAIGIFVCLPTFAADPIAQMHDAEVRRVEREILPLVEAMPADKFDFAPTSGTFKGVRTFGLQARYIATIIYQYSSAVLQENPPVDTGVTDNGPDSIRSKDQIVAYFKGAIAFAHKAMDSLTVQNQLDIVKLPYGGPLRPRVYAASWVGWHSYDHYGQMVVYARMNGVIPPASQPPPPVCSQNQIRGGGRSTRRP
jgi:hypothetical protein